MIDFDGEQLTPVSAPKEDINEGSMDDEIMEQDDFHNLVKNRQSKKTLA